MRIFRHQIIDILVILTCFIFCLFALGCGGSDGGGGGSATGSGSSGTSNTVVSLPQENLSWDMYEVKHLDAEGLLVPQISAAVGADGIVRIAYYSDGTDFGNENRYSINMIRWDPGTQQILSEDVLNPQSPESGGEGLDNCNPLSLALTYADYPVIAYQGGLYRDQSLSDGEQSDVMFSMFDGQDWPEYTGAIGYVDRNPLYDGLAGSDLSAAVDSEGNIHICFQFYYEGMDSYNFSYPALNYVKHDAASMGNVASGSGWADMEETVYGSVFTSTSAVHRGVGYSCKLLLDDNDNPAVFFTEYTDYSNTYGLWFASRSSTGEWQRQWVERVGSNWTIGDVSAAKAPNGEFAVAYTKQCSDCDDDEGDHLKYALRSGSGWNVQVVDQSSICGYSPALAFDSQGNPAIAYYDLKSYSGRSRKYLKFASLSNSVWTTETVAENDDFGHHNSLWFDGDDIPFICTWSEAVDDIAIFEKH